MKIESRGNVDFTVSTVRRERMLGATLDAVNYGDAKAVQRARAAIMHMGIGDRLDDIGSGGGKREALKRLADALLCEKAAEWQKGGSDRVLCKEMRKLDRRETQARFLEMLSPDQRRAVLATPQETEDGIRFSPGTGSELADLLSMTFSVKEGKNLLRFDDVGDAWQSARTHELDGIRWKEQAEALRTNGSHRLAAEAWAQAGEQFSASGRSSEAAEAYDHAASDLMADDSQALTSDRRHLAASEALGAAAEHWHDAGRHERSAASRHGQAAYFTKLGMHDEAAECTRIERRQRDLHFRQSYASELPQDILREVASRLTDSESLQAFALVNANWNAAVAPWQNDARAAAKIVNDQVAKDGVEQLDDAVARIKQLPVSHQLAPLLQLIDKLWKNPWGYHQIHAAITIDNLKVFQAIERATADLSPRDQRELYTKLTARVRDLPSRTQPGAWRACFNKIREIYAIDPRDMGPSLIELVERLPYGIENDAPDYLGLESMITGLKDGDPYKKKAQRKFATLRSNRS